MTASGGKVNPAHALQDPRGVGLQCAVLCRVTLAGAAPALPSMSPLAPGSQASSFSCSPVGCCRRGHVPAGARPLAMVLIGQGLCQAGYFACHPRRVIFLQNPHLRAHSRR